jgi:hypothetical protein
VNPSATIAAVAEFKIEQFIQRQKPGWAAAEKPTAADWMQSQRAQLDPLNPKTQARRQSQEPKKRICLEFDEVMSGFIDGRATGPSPWTTPRRMSGSASLARFNAAEDEGIKRGHRVDVTLHAIADDLASLIAPADRRQPARITLSGHIKVGALNEPLTLAEKGCYMQMFMQPDEREPPLRWFFYHLEYDDENRRRRVLDGVKILSNAPGLDIWYDTSTLYFEVRDAEFNATADAGVQRGILRVPADTFLRKQLPSMTIKGTCDPDRQTWALAAFYKYFAGELVAVYGERATELSQLLMQLVTGIHV